MSRRNGRNVPHGFELSDDIYEPSHYMQGRIPNMMRTRNYPQSSPFASLMGSDVFDSMCSNFDRHASALVSPFGSDFIGESLMPSFNGMHSFMQSSSSFPSGGVYQSSVSVMTSYTDKDGKQRVERYKKAAYGNKDKDMCEVTEAYSNSASGKDVMVAERRKKNKGLQMTRERDNNTNVTEEYQQRIELDENEVDEFNRDWQDEFRQYMPALGPGAGGVNSTPALPARRRRQLKQ